MNRRAFLKLTASLAANFSGAYFMDADALLAPSPVAAMLTIDPARTGATIPPDFLGLSYESSMLGDPAFFTPQNAGLLALIKRLGSNGVLRIGGNSSAVTHWQSESGQAKPGRQTVITPATIQRLGEFVRASGWSLIYGLNLGQGAASQAVSEAAAAAQALGAKLIAFQIGNEPDLFASKHNRLRPMTYSYDDYLSEWQAFAQAIKAAVPNAKFAGPDTAGGPAWVAQFAEDVPDAVFFSQHYYAEGPAGSPLVTISRLLNSTSRLASVLVQLQRTARAAGRPYRITEMNSCYDGGQGGVSDTFAAALWGVTALFQMVDAGCAGVNFHGGPRGAYTPIAQTHQMTYEARPLYYAMLFFAQCGPGQLVTARLAGVSRLVTVYAVRHDDGALTLALVNAHATRGFSITVDPGEAFACGTALRLTAPSLDAKTNITFGGSEVGADASWQATVGETITVQDRQFSFDLPAASAACVRLTA